MVQNAKLKETSRQNKTKRSNVTLKIKTPSFPSAALKNTILFGSPVHAIIAAAEKKLAILFGDCDDLKIIEASENSTTPPTIELENRRAFLAEPKGWTEAILNDDFDEKF